MAPGETDQDRMTFVSPLVAASPAGVAGGATDWTTTPYMLRAGLSGCFTEKVPAGKDFL